MGGSRFTSGASWVRAAATMASLALAFAAAFGLASAFGQAQANAGQPATAHALQVQSLTGAQLEAQATASDMENSWGLKSIFAQDAQTIATEKAKAAGDSDTPIRVAVIDTGFYANHPALKGKIKAQWNADAIGEQTTIPTILSSYSDTRKKTEMDKFKKIAEDASIEPPDAITNDSSRSSEANHGTHVASIAGTVAPDVEFVLIRIADNNGEMQDWALFNAFALINQYCNEYNIRVVNCSAGSDGLAAKNLWKEKTEEQITAIYNKGVVTVASAGNEAKKKGRAYDNFPSDCESVVGVMSLEYDSVDNPYAVHRLSTSNYNATNQTSKNICAPGAHIPGAVRTSSGTYSYELMSGTSMAAPHVAGVLALMMRTNPLTYGASADGARAAVDKLYSSATRLDASDWSEEYGWGEVNAAAAVSDGGAIPDTTTSLENGTQTTFSMSCPNAQSPTYAWSILHGSGNAEFVGATNEARATLWAVHDGQVIISCIGRASSSTGTSSAVFWACKTLTVSGGEISGPDTVVLDSAMPKSYRDGTAHKQFSVTGTTTTSGITWSSSNPSVLSVTSKGAVTGKAVGTATLSASWGNVKLEKEVEVTAVDLTSVTDLGYYVALYFETATYDGTAQKPAVKLYLVKSSWKTALSNGTADVDSSSLDNDRVKLSQGTDYAVAGYSSNVNAGNKTAKVTVSGRGNYRGNKSYNFTIFAAALTASDVKLSQTKYTYNGKAHKPSVTVKHGGKTLVRGTDYTVKWENYTAAGTGKVIVTGKGNYGGTATKTYTISKAKNTLAVKALTRSASAGTLKKSAVTLARPVSVSKAQGAVTFAKKSGNSKITVNKTTGKLKLARGLKKGAYKVKIQVHAAGNASYYGLSKQVIATVRVV